MERLSIDEIIEHCKRQTQRFEQLNGTNTLETADITLTFIKEYWEHRQVKEYLEELKSYRQQIIKQPCKLGDIVYDIVLCDDGKYHIFPMKVCNINLYGDIHKGKVWNVYLEDNYTKAYRSFYDFGKTVFLFSEEANSALNRMLETESNKEKSHHCKLCGSYIKEDNLKICNKCATEYQY